MGSQNPIIHYEVILLRNIARIRKSSSKTPKNSQRSMVKNVPQISPTSFVVTETPFFGITLSLLYTLRFFRVALCTTYNIFLSRTPLLVSGVEWPNEHCFIC